MIPSPHSRPSSYSSTTGVIFLFNLIVGTGALALPGALQTSGWIVGIVLLIILALFSFITVTFIVETLAISNAINRKRALELSAQAEENEGEEAEETPLNPRTGEAEPGQTNNVFEMKEKFEIGQMGLLVTPKWCQIIIYLCLCIYLFGDLAIYAAVLGATTTTIICSKTSESHKKIGDDPCWVGYPETQLTIYRISVSVFIFILGPLVFFNLQKTKFLQYFTLTMRWCAFFIMFGWSIQKLSTEGQKGNPVEASYKGLPTLFGALVYSFMCQHSIPGLLVPIKNKTFLTRIISIDFILSSMFYISLSTTAIFTFEKVDDIYTLNFWDETAGKNTSIFLKFLSYFLALFPIFTLSTNFPIIGITLRNNLRNMILRNHPYIWYYDRLLFPLITILPPTVVAVAVSDIHLLLGIIGSYAGACVQYLIPCLLVSFARSAAKEFTGKNGHASPFRGKKWVIIVYVWFVLSLIFITIHYSIKFK